MDKRQLIIDTIDELSTDELIYLWREYCSETSRFDDEIFSSDDFDELLSGQSVGWIMNRVYYGDYNPTADYWTFDGYGNIKSIFAYELSDYIDTEEIADFILENDNSLYNDDIREILDNTEDVEND